MKNQLLKDIYKEQKKASHDLHSIENILCGGILYSLLKEAKAKEDVTAVKMCKAGMLLVALSQLLVIASSAADIIQMKDKDYLDE